MRLHPFKYAEKDWRSAAGIAEGAMTGTKYLIRWALRLTGGPWKKKAFDSPEVLRRSWMKKSRLRAERFIWGSATHYVVTLVTPDFPLLLSQSLAYHVQSITLG